MSRYELYLLLHIGAAMIWVGAAFAMAILETRASLAGSPARVVALAREAAFLGPWLYLPTNLLVLVSAFLLAEEANWSYGTLWIQLGFAGFGLSFLIGALFFSRGWARIGALVADVGVDSPRVHAPIRRMLVASWLDVGVLLAVVFVMTVKPSQDDTVALAVVAALPVACTAVAFALLRARAARPHPDGTMEAATPGA